MGVKRLLAFHVLLMIGSCIAALDFRYLYSEPEKDVFDIMDILIRPRKPERFLPKSYFQKFGYRGTRLTEFSFEDCGSPGRETVKVSQLELTPDPLVLPGEIGLAFKAVNSKGALAPIQAEVTLKKKIGFWIEVPCIDNVGSCSYDDICKLLPRQQCPPAFLKYKIPCHCPVPAANFTVPGVHFRANVNHVPGGDYSVKVVMKSQSGPLACIKMMFSIE